MGRGRAKAKQTKVARDLKYNSDRTDLDRLRAELTGATTTAQRPDVAEDEHDDPYAGYVDDEDEDASRP